MEFSIGFPLTEEIRVAILSLWYRHWYRCHREVFPGSGGGLRGRAHRGWTCRWPSVLASWLRKEEPHPGAQFNLFDVDGYRYPVLLGRWAPWTCGPGGPPVDLDLLQSGVVMGQTPPVSSWVAPATRLAGVQGLPPAWR